MDADPDVEATTMKTAIGRRTKARIIRTMNRMGDTPLQMAVASRHIKLMMLLLKVDDLCQDTAHDGDGTDDEEEHSRNVSTGRTNLDCPR